AAADDDNICCVVGHHVPDLRDSRRKRTGLLFGVLPALRARPWHAGVHLVRRGRHSVTRGRPCDGRPTAVAGWLDRAGQSTTPDGVAVLRVCGYDRVVRHSQSIATYR